MSSETTTTPIATIDMRKASKMVKTGFKDTIKFRKWMKLYIELGNASQAAKLAYHCKDSSAGAIGSENLKKVNFNELMELAGLTDSLLLSKTIEGLQSEKIHSSHTEPDRVIPDMAVRHKYLETAYKLKGRLKEDTTTVIVDKTLLMDAVPTTVIEGETVPEASSYDK